MSFIRSAALIALALFGATTALAETIAIIGTGKVGRAVALEFAEQGHTIIIGSRSPAGLKALDLADEVGDEASTDKPADAASEADIVVLAVPGNAVVDVAASLGDLSGKIVIDLTNPLGMDSPMHFVKTVETSNGELVQAALPGALVVKALNTVTWQTMMNAEDLEGPVSVPLSGDDDQAKARVAALVTGMGLTPIDIGPVDTSRWSELSAVIMLNNQFSERTGFDFYLRPAN